MPPDAAIHIESLSYCYPGGSRALDGVAFDVTSGEAVGLVGPNGAGKTTLFLCLAGVLAPSGGSIRVAGLDPARKEDRKKLPASLGILFQNSDDQLFNASVFDDVAFGPLNLDLPADEVRRRVAMALAAVALVGFEQRVPFHLSGGERRRVALAGVLAMQPSILLFDEPTSFLDPRGRRELIHLIQGHSVTRLIASHDLEMILETCSRCVLLDGGKLICTGPVRELFADRELMERHGLEVPHSLRPR